MTSLNMVVAEGSPASRVAAPEPRTEARPLLAARALH
eukprot:CAMPEP_0198472790 /NCGR_PEP_ID=MMETSP1456-20131121/31696_1 /TAXON_ID=1461544 ORGANISM="Unidentified sp., Strain RCC1871" /NCGR_SAMPLE_ID=MMETSP1456 /ASSEMBLY_ACC=CAM_ASM_001119 /LENGTH=36 /DNA_ID= /DNA_START= /DNA_END= /DNA_ORIENTATION=